MIRSLIWLMVLSCLATAALADARVEISAPAADQPLFGWVTITAVVSNDEGTVRVDFAVDGHPVGSISKPPYSLEVDVGDENRSHLIEVVVKGRHGELARATLTSPAVHVDESVDLELQQLYVTVTDRRGERVLGLESADFEVTDDGVRQRLITVAGGEIPLTATILLDASISMQGGDLEVALKGAQAFIDGMVDLDEARVMVASDHLRLMTPFSGEPETLRQAVSHADAGGGTALLDHLATALLGLEARQGRRVVIVLSDGLDVHSTLGTNELDRIARSSQAMIYWVRLHARKFRRVPWGSEPATVLLSAWRGDSEAHALLDGLEKVVRRSGGRVVSVDSPAETVQAFGDILAELREQYALGYYPEPRWNDSRWRPVRVLARKRALKTRTRDGYVDR